MKFTSTYKNIKRSDALDVDIQKTFQKFESFFDEEIKLHATMSFKGKNDTRKCVEITIKTDGYTYRAESLSDSFHKCVDMDYDKLKKQMRRHKDKMIARKRVTAYENYKSYEDEPKIEEPKEEIVKKKKFKLHFMNPEEATLQMELLGHDFFMFTNGETGDINVVYKRKNGGYGLIEPV